MRPIRILVANEPRSYREAFVEVFRELRPDAEVREALPEDLDREVERFGPDLVFCSRLTPTVERDVPARVELYPAEEPAVAIFTAGELSTVMNADLNTLLSVIDRTRAFLENDGPPPAG